MQISFVVRVAARGKIFLTALPSKFSEDARKLARDEAKDQKMRTLGRRCGKIATAAGCWVNFASSLGIPSLPHYCLPFGPASSAPASNTMNPFLHRLLRLLKACRKDSITEATLRGFFWDPLIGHALGGGVLRRSGVVCELEVGKLFDSNNNRFVDLAATSNRFNAPILLVEMTRHVVPPGDLHKDFAKLAVSMTLSCQRLCRNMSDNGVSFLDARVYGALIGGPRCRSVSPIRI